MAGGGGIGTRGPGETKIETDRRRIRTRTGRLRRQLAEMSVGRQVQRAAAAQPGPSPAVAIAGYTNAGKSSLLNRLTGAGVLVDDSLFATLDPAVRKARDPGRALVHPDRHRRLRPAPAASAGRGVPVHAGGSGPRPTLILHVVDERDDADPQAQISAVREVLGEIGAGGTSPSWW